MATREAVSVNHPGGLRKVDETSAIYRLGVGNRRILSPSAAVGGIGIGAAIGSD